MKSRWQTKRLGDVCERVTVGHVGTTSPYYRNSGILFLRTQNVGKTGLILDDIKYVTPEFHSSLNKSEVKAGDILISRVITHTVHCALIPPDLGPANCANVVIVRPSATLLPEFLMHYIRSAEAQRHLLDRKVGAAQSVVNTRVVQSWPIPVPPFREQKRIVGILDEAIEGIATAKANAEKNLQNARNLFESHLQSVFTQRGKGWMERPLDDVASILNGYSFRSTDFSAKRGVKCIKITNVGVREFVCDSGGNLPESFAAEYARVCVKKDSIVLALTRTIISGGLKVAIVPDEYDGALLNQRVAAILPDRAAVSSEFLFAYLCTQSVLDYVKDRVNTLMQPNLSIVDLRAMPIPVPPFKLQTKLVHQIESLREETRRIATIYERKLAALNELKKSLLHRAFSGEL